MAIQTALDSISNSTSGSPFGFKNRIINGAMAIDQRNAGASQSYGATGSTYCLDRFFLGNSQTSKVTSQQNAGSVTPPAGFGNYLGITVVATATIGAADAFYVSQPIEAANLSDLNWGTANAQPITISAWVRSSVTGTFGGSVINSGAISPRRTYCFTYSIPVANTWTYVSVTIPGDTTGTWYQVGNGVGMYVVFAYGVGSSGSTTPGSFQNSDAISATGAASIMGTNGATWQITGWQLEKGSTATSFDYRPYGVETTLCYRYYYKSPQYSTYSPVGVGRAWSTTNGNAPFYLPVPMRSNQTITYSSLSHFDVVTLGNPTAIQNDGAGPNNVKVGWQKSGMSSGTLYQFEYGNTTDGWLAFSAEL
jgi:hypothetical protein